MASTYCAPSIRGSSCSSSFQDDRSTCLSCSARLLRTHKNNQAFEHKIPSRYSVAPSAVTPIDRAWNHAAVPQLLSQAAHLLASREGSQQSGLLKPSSSTKVPAPPQALQHEGAPAGIPGGPAVYVPSLCKAADVQNVQPGYAIAIKALRQTMFSANSRMRHYEACGLGLGTARHVALHREAFL